MVNPQLTQNLLAVIRSLPEEDRHWLLDRLEHDASEPSTSELALMTTAGAAFNDLADEPDLYNFLEGEPVISNGC